MTRAGSGATRSGMSESALTPTQAKVVAVLERIADGEYTSKACEAVGIQRSTIWRAVDGPESAPELRIMYARAREQQADAHFDRVAQMADKLVSMADNPDVTSAQVLALRSACDQHRWAAAKLRPQRYGEKVEHTVNAQVTSVAVVTASPALAAQLLELGRLHARGRVVEAVASEASSEPDQTPSDNELGSGAEQRRSCP